MNAVQWLIWLVPEMIKTLLITYGIFGFEFKKRRWWFVVAAYILREGFAYANRGKIWAYGGRFKGQLLFLLYFLENWVEN